MQTLTMYRPVRILQALLCLLAALWAEGCALPPYRCAERPHMACDVRLKPGEPQVERGRPAPVVDAVGWVIGVPAKLWMLNDRVANHDITFKTETALQEYLDTNGLDQVKVRLNEYDPAGEWDRLVHNESICWPVRYTVGTLSVVGYTVLPGRILGCDDYNPFTNTINLYSDVAPIGLYLGGHAKDFAQREQKGWYALGYVVPILNIHHQRRAAADAKNYLRVCGSSDEMKEGYRTIWPFYMARCSSVIDAATGLPVALVAVATGHVVGQIEAARVPDGLPPVPPPSECQPNAVAQPPTSQ